MSSSDNAETGLINSEKNKHHHFGLNGPSPNPQGDYVTIFGVIEQLR